MSYKLAYARVKFHGRAATVFFLMWIHRYGFNS